MTSVMGESREPLLLQRTPAEAALVERTVALLRGHDATELADAVERSRVKLYPWRHGRRRYWQAQVQVQVVVSGPDEVWSHLALRDEDVDRLLREELAVALSPALFPRTVEIHAEAA